MTGESAMSSINRHGGHVPNYRYFV